MVESAFQPGEPAPDLVVAAQPAVPVRSRWSRRRRALIAFAIFFAFLVCVLWYIGVLGGNVRVVVPGKLYRSAQLTGFNYTAVSAGLENMGLVAVIKRYGIKTVINLRGGDMHNRFYREEIRDCAAMGVQHVDAGMSAVHLPPPAALDDVLNAFDHDRYPFLIHCQGGADRTGLVSTLYLVVYQHVPLSQAEDRELTWRFGHLEFTATRAMNRFYALYRRTGHGEPLRQWILRDYPHVYAAGQP